MSDENDKKPNIFQKTLAAGDLWINSQIEKGQSEVKKEVKEELEDETDFFYRKSVSRDESYYIGSQGFQEKPKRLTFEHLRQVAIHDSVISAIIQTRQNQVAGFTRCVKNKFEKGFMVSLKNYDSVLDKVTKLVQMGVEEEAIIEELREKIDLYDSNIIEEANTNADILKGLDGEALTYIEPPDTLEERLDKAIIAKREEIKVEKEELLMKAKENEGKAEEKEESTENISNEEENNEDKKLEDSRRVQRRARAILEEAIKPRKRYIEQFLLNCGIKNNRPFESRKWNFNTISRAIIRDSLQYDQFGVEIIPDQAGRPHHYVPVDGSTIRYASPELRRYKSWPTQSNYDILYPEAELEALESKDALELDPDKLAADAYKYVQVIKGKLDRAFTAKELKVGIRNCISDIYNNGYGLSELELVVKLVTSHLHTENYNQSYFSQGFSAKGILHIKAPLNRRKLESIRQQWMHMIKGNRNSFQTPIFAGLDEVNWIPLTQNHSDIEFQGWLQYLIKMICGIYQIDPQEIGIGMKEEGSKGNGLSGDNTQEKIELSRDKGLYPLLIFLENFFNVNVIDNLDPDFEITFVGLKDESPKEALERQKKEAEFKKTVNEIRAEDGLDPLPGMDNFILNQQYFQWYAAFSTPGKAAIEAGHLNTMTQELMSPEKQEEAQPKPANGDSKPKTKVAKALQVEVFKIED